MLLPIRVIAAPSISTVVWASAIGLSRVSTVTSTNAIGAPGLAAVPASRPVAVRTAAVTTATGSAARSPPDSAGRPLHAATTPTPSIASPTRLTPRV